MGEVFTHIFKPFWPSKANRLFVTIGYFLIVIFLSQLALAQTSSPTSVSDGQVSTANNSEDLNLNANNVLTQKSEREMDDKEIDEVLRQNIFDRDHTSHELVDYIYDQIHLDLIKITRLTLRYNEILENRFGRDEELDHTKKEIVVTNAKIINKMQNELKILYGIKTDVVIDNSILIGLKGLKIIPQKESEMYRLLASYMRFLDFEPADLVILYQPALLLLSDATAFVKIHSFVLSLDTYSLLELLKGNLTNITNHEKIHVFQQIRKVKKKDSIYNQIFFDLSDNKFAAHELEAYIAELFDLSKKTGMFSSNKDYVHVKKYLSILKLTAEHILYHSQRCYKTIEDTIQGKQASLYHSGYALENGKYFMFISSSFNQFEYLYEIVNEKETEIIKRYLATHDPKDFTDALNISKQRIFNINSKSYQILTQSMQLQEQLEDLVNRFNSKKIDPGTISLFLKEISKFYVSSKENQHDFLTSPKKMLIPSDSFNSWEYVLDKSNSTEKNIDLTAFNKPVRVKNLPKDHRHLGWGVFHDIPGLEENDITDPRVNIPVEMGGLRPGMFGYGWRRPHSRTFANGGGSSENSQHTVQNFPHDEAISVTEYVKFAAEAIRNFDAVAFTNVWGRAGEDKYNPYLLTYENKPLWEIAGDAYLVVLSDDPELTVKDIMTQPENTPKLSTLRRRHAKLEAHHGTLNKATLRRYESIKNIIRTMLPRKLASGLIDNIDLSSLFPEGSFVAAASLGDIETIQYLRPAMKEETIDRAIVMAANAHRYEIVEYLLFHDGVSESALRDIAQQLGNMNDKLDATGIREFIAAKIQINKGKPNEYDVASTRDVSINEDISGKILRIRTFITKWNKLNRRSRLSTYPDMPGILSVRYKAINSLDRIEKYSRHMKNMWGGITIDDIRMWFALDKIPESVFEEAGGHTFEDLISYILTPIDQQTTDKKSMSTNMAESGVDNSNWTKVRSPISIREIKDNETPGSDDKVYLNRYGKLGEELFHGMPGMEPNDGFVDSYNRNNPGFAEDGPMGLRSSNVISNHGSVELMNSGGRTPNDDESNVRDLQIRDKIEALRVFITRWNKWPNRRIRLYLDVDEIENLSKQSLNKFEQLKEFYPKFAARKMWQGASPQELKEWFNQGLIPEDIFPGDSDKTFESLIARVFTPTDKVSGDYPRGTGPNEIEKINPSDDDKKRISPDDAIHISDVFPKVLSNITVANRSREQNPPNVEQNETSENQDKKKSGEFDVAENVKLGNVNSDVKKYAFVERWNSEHPENKIETFEQLKSLFKSLATVESLRPYEALEILADQRDLIYRYLIDHLPEKYRHGRNINQWLDIHLNDIQKEIPQILGNHRVLRSLHIVAGVASGMTNIENDENPYRELLQNEEPLNLVVGDDQYLALSKKIDDLNLSTQEKNALKNGNILIVLDLVQFHKDQLLKLKNFNQKGVSNVENLLYSMGLKLGSKVSPEMIESIKAYSENPGTLKDGSKNKSSEQKNQEGSGSGYASFLGLGRWMEVHGTQREEGIFQQTYGWVKNTWAKVNAGSQAKSSQDLKSQGTTSKAGSTKEITAADYKSLVEGFNLQPTAETKKAYFKKHQVELIASYRAMVKAHRRAELIAIHTQAVAQFGEAIFHGAVTEYPKFFLAGLWSQVAIAILDPKMGSVDVVDLLRGLPENFWHNAIFASGSAAGSSFYEVMHRALVRKMEGEIGQAAVAQAFQMEQNVTLANLLKREASIVEGIGKNQIAMLVGTILSMATGPERSRPDFWEEVARQQISFFITQAMTREVLLRGMIAGASLSRNVTSVLTGIEASGRVTLLVGVVAFGIDLVWQHFVRGWMDHVELNFTYKNRVSRAYIQFQDVMGSESKKEYSQRDEAKMAEALEVVLKSANEYWDIIIEENLSQIRQKYESLQNEYDEAAGLKLIHMRKDGRAMYPVVPKGMRYQVATMLHQRRGSELVWVPESKPAEVYGWFNGKIRNDYEHEAREEERKLLTQIDADLLVKLQTYRRAREEILEQVLKCEIENYLSCPNGIDDPYTQAMEEGLSGLLSYRAVDYGSGGLLTQMIKDSERMKVFNNLKAWTITDWVAFLLKIARELPQEGMFVRSNLISQVVDQMEQHLSGQHLYLVPMQDVSSPQLLLGEYGPVVGNLYQKPTYDSQKARQGLVTFVFPKPKTESYPQGYTAKEIEDEVRLTIAEMAFMNKWHTCVQHDKEIAPGEFPAFYFDQIQTNKPLRSSFFKARASVDLAPLWKRVKQIQQEETQANRHLFLRTTLQVIQQVEDPSPTLGSSLSSEIERPESALTASRLGAPYTNYISTLLITQAQFDVFEAAFPCEDPTLGPFTPQNYKIYLQKNFSNLSNSHP